MDDNTACVLRTIVRHAPCTKLCVKQQSRLSMSAVLRAIDELSRADWVRIDTYTVPQGGKPHSNICPSARPVYGAAKTAKGWEVCARTLDGREELIMLPDLDGLSPLTVVADTSTVDIPVNARVIEVAQGIAAYLAVQQKGVYVDEQLRLWLPEGTHIALGALPSPLLQGTRLDYCQAFARATPTQKNRLMAELALTINTLRNSEGVYFAEQIDLTAPQAGAWACVYDLIGHL
jgi:hypothetical protein